MSYQIELHREALAELKALPAYVRAQVIELIDLLAATPRPPRAKELRDKPGIYRIWLAGRWRIAYEINDEQQTIIVRRIRRKSEIDYESL
ncbi:type II toxin-antitoxin system RelE/ParE family toxin [Candidatus Chloroploca sp. Khr17]|uniref:type II toxin-antitoxin system RelE family toxin n=1 Tax=Candidatus Chloroploca sp. Khr17 TaxID=2496869 RepID=UPI0013EB9EBF|nr:type II toxin-antitoxin system RelE/ParE family toxin [Candidatus Chloroploca sp. Khr17]